MIFKIMDDNQNPMPASMPNDIPIQTPTPIIPTPIIPTSTPGEQEKGAMPTVPEQGAN